MINQRCKIIGIKNAKFPTIFCANCINHVMEHTWANERNGALWQWHFKKVLFAQRYAIVLLRTIFTQVSEAINYVSFTTLLNNIWQAWGKKKKIQLIKNQNSLIRNLIPIIWSELIGERKKRKKKGVERYNDRTRSVGQFVYLNEWKIKILIGFNWLVA